MSWKNWRDHPFVVTVSVLAGLAGLITLGYTVFLNSGLQQSTRGNNSPNINAHNGDVQVNIENPTDTTKVVPLQQGMQYKEARRILIEQGWQASIPSSMGGFPNLDNSAVKKLFDLGYQEVKDCSGAGLGLCRFEFIGQEGELLAVSATEEVGSESGERTVRYWSLEKNRGTFR